MFTYGKSAATLAALLVLGTTGMATADENVEMSLTTTCDCFQMGSLSSYVGEVFAAAVVEVPRSSVEGKTEQELRDGLTARQMIALQDAAKNACSLQAARNLGAQRSYGGSRAGELRLAPGDRVRVYCAGDINFRVSRR